jgi:CheY-like chemotaxis protein
MPDYVLVVDDDRMFWQVICHALNRDGFNAIPAGGGAEALELVRTSLPKLILLDLVMPGVNGLQLLGVLKADARTSGIPIIVLSATMSDDATKQARALGASTILFKTQFSMMELRQLVNDPQASAA